MNNIVRRKVAGILLLLLTTIALVDNVKLMIVNAEAFDESEVITDYNSDYYDSYDEFIGDASVHFIIDEANIVNDENANSEAPVEIFNSVDDAGTYVRKCMVNRVGKIEFIFTNQEGYTGAEGFAAIKEATFVETYKPNEGDYLYWNYAGLEGRFDKVDSGLKYTLYPSYLSSAEEEAIIDERVQSLMANEFYGWESMTDFEITKQVYTWVTGNFTFVGGSDRHSTYSGIIEQETVCQGFATTIYRLLREMGVPCRVVSNNDHGWNIVKIGDCYYNIDATWDVGLHESQWENFLLANESFEQGSMHLRGNRYTIDTFNKSYPMSENDYEWTPEELTVGVEYKAHIQSQGWQSWVSDGALSGTVGESKRLEAFEVVLKHPDCIDIDVEYMAYIESRGWESDWKSSSQISGTEGKAKRLEAIKIKLTGDDSEEYDVFYRVHVQSFGWLGWAKNGENAGTTGLSKRIEGVQIVVLPKGQKPDGVVGYSFIAYGKTILVDENKAPMIVYNTHVQTYGWQKSVSDGSISGTFGESKRLEGIKISLGEIGYEGGIQYRTHVQTRGWEEDWKYDGEMSGTEGQAKRIEAIQIKLYGETAEHYDVYYRVHVQSLGWLEWVKNGETAGTEGQGKRMESIQIVVVPR